MFGGLKGLHKEDMGWIKSWVTNDFEKPFWSLSYSQWTSCTRTTAEFAAPQVPRPLLWPLIIHKTILRSRNGQYLVQPLYCKTWDEHDKFPIYSWGINKDFPHWAQVSLMGISMTIRRFNTHTYTHTYRIMPYTSAGHEGTTPRRSLFESQEESFIISNIFWCCH